MPAFRPIQSVSDTNALQKHFVCPIIPIPGMESRGSIGFQKINFARQQEGNRPFSAIPER
jgi:hypothetical protein